MPTTIVIESFEEFSARHGTFIRDDTGRFIFPTGATAAQNPVNARWSLIEPPGDDETRLEIQKSFWATKVERAEKDFRALKCSLTGWKTDGQTYDNRFAWDDREYGTGPADGTEALKIIQRAVFERRAELKIIEDAIFILPHNVAAREAAREAEAEREKMHLAKSQLETEIEKITI